MSLTAICITCMIAGTWRHLTPTTPHARYVATTLNWALALSALLSPSDTSSTAISTPTASSSWGSSSAPSGPWTTTVAVEAELARLKGPRKELD